ncbi:MAG TPA: tetratricopeptide repeat protein, partial [Deferrisomatales bacterium]|nr:tetratricopeptide repeat protein [Deferrisomatales bacterium]
MAIDREKLTRAALRFTQKGQFLKAIAEYKKLLSLDPRDIRTRLKLLDLYGRAGRKAEAIAECADVAESYADQGFYLKAIAVYKQALRIDPENPSLYRDMGEMYVKQGLVGDALGAYKKGVEVLRGFGRGEEAEELLVRMEEMAPENAAIKVHLAELYIESDRFDAFEVILGKLILQLRGEGRSRKLLQAVESFYDKSSHHPSILKRLAELYVELGEEERALAVVREGLATQPADRDLRLLALRAYLLTNQLMDARRMALALCEEDPDDLHILEQLASIAQARGDQQELAGTYKAMAKVYARKGLRQKEEQYYRQVAELVPDDAEARLALGEVTLEDALPEVGAEP